MSYCLHDDNNTGDYHDIVNKAKIGSNNSDYTRWEYATERATAWNDVKYIEFHVDKYDQEIDSYIVSVYFYNYDYHELELDNDVVKISNNRINKISSYHDFEKLYIQAKESEAFTY